MDDPAILQLHKWDPSQTQIPLSEFRQAFISPTRHILLLHSYQNQALLFPLVKGESNSSGGESSNDYDRPNGSGLVNDLPCTSGSEIGIDTNVAENKCSRSNSYPFISDVNSLAWARCGDTYDQHNDASFREFLFVSGTCGVTVHAFPKLTKAKEIVQSALEGSYRQGRWVEWGPIVTLAQNMEVGDEGGVEFLRGSAPTKRYLKSFFTKVETIVADGSLRTKFPENKDFPCSTEVVSFNIFDGSLSLEYLFNQESVQSKEKQQEPADLVEDASDHSSLSSGTEDIKSDCFSKVFGIEINGFYECPKIFSSASYCLVGFFLTLMHHVSVNNSGANHRRRSKNLLLVARLDNSGIQWVSVVKLDERTNIVQEVEWMDFQFCDNLLACLDSSGLITLYSAISGEFVTHLNVSQACGLGPLFDFHGSEKLPLSDDGTCVKQGSDIKDNMYDQHRDSFRRSFKRLIVASHTYFLAVVDACGVIYVISLSEYVTDKSYFSEKLLPYCQQFGLGMLVGWGAGGSDIDCQAAFSNFSGNSQSNDLNIKSGSVSYPDKAVEGDALQKIDGYTSKERRNLFGPYSSGFSPVSNATNDHKFTDSDVKSPVMRKIFLPNFKLCEDDSISFSPIGITILSKMKNVKNQSGSKLVHFNLQVKLDAHDDNLLDSAYDVYHFNGKEESVFGEVVGCTFHGCFYIVREDGLSVYIPSVSILSSFLPVEYIGYRQPSIDRGISVLLKDNVEAREPTKRFSPWKIEILDRVLVYEGIEEADQLCSKNGWDIKISRIRQLQIALDYLKFDEIESFIDGQIFGNACGCESSGRRDFEIAFCCSLSYA